MSTPEPSDAASAAPWRTRRILALGLGVALIVAPGLGSGYFGATGRIDVAGPLVCPRGTAGTRVERVVEHESDGDATNYYLDCVDGAGRAQRVPTLRLIAALYLMMAAPAAALALVVAFAHWRAHARVRAA